MLYLKRHKIPHCGLGQENNLQLARKRKENKEVLKISVIIAILYRVLTLPLQIQFLSYAVFENTSLANVLTFFASDLLIFHSCCNPIVYGTISRPFRAEIADCVRLCHRSCCRRNRTVKSVDGNTQELGFNMAGLQG